MKPQKPLRFAAVPSSFPSPSTSAGAVAAGSLPGLPESDEDFYSVRRRRNGRLGKKNGFTGKLKNGGPSLQLVTKDKGEKSPANCHNGLKTAVLALTLLSIPLVYTASVPIAMDQHHGNANYFVLRQLMFVVVGCAFLELFSRLKLPAMRNMCWGLYFLSVLGLVATKFTPLGVNMGNTERWLNLGFATVQISEFAKIAVIGVMADFWVRAMHDPAKRASWKPWLTSFLIVSVPALLVALQPHLSAFLLIMALPLAAAVFAGAAWKNVATVVGVTVTLATLILGTHGAPLGITLIKPYQMQRVYSQFGMGSNATAQAGNYQREQGLRALSRGGLTGVGPGNSLYKNGHLPAPMTDFIYAVIGEEFGLFGTLLLLVLYAVIVFFCLNIGYQSRDGFGAVLCSGVGTLVGLQAVTNVSIVAGWGPVTGVPLPIITFGGSGLIATLMGLALVLAISRRQGIESGAERRADSDLAMAA